MLNIIFGYYNSFWMYKEGIAIFFMVVFMSLIIAPSIIAAVDDSIDTSIIYSLTEEEEHSKTKVVINFSLHLNDALSDFTLNPCEFFSYQFKSYSKPHVNLIFSPPDQIIL